MKIWGSENPYSRIFDAVTALEIDCAPFTDGHIFSMKVYACSVYDQIMSTSDVLSLIQEEFVTV